MLSMSKLTTLLLLGFLCNSHGVRKDDRTRFAKDFEKFAELDLKVPPPSKDLTLFTGSSTIRRWTSLSNDFPSTALLNRGFGGSQLSQVHHHFDELFSRYKPTRIILYCGENDLWHGKSVEKTLEDFRTLVNRIRQILPKTRLVYLSCKPSPKRMAKWNTYQKLNSRIASICSKDPLLQFVDLSPLLLASDGKPAPGIWDQDDLHLNSTGYARLAKLLAPILEN